MNSINLEDIWKSIVNIYFSLLRNIQDKIKSPRAFGLIFSVFLLGFTSARFVVSIISYSLASDISKNSDTGAQSYNPVKKNIGMASVDLSTIIDGVFFKRAPAEANLTAGAEPEEVKNFSLIGTLEGDPSFARAVIRIQGSKEEPKEYALGEKIGIAKLIAIGYEKIWVRINGKKVKVEVGENIQDTQSNTAVASADGETQTKILSRQEINEKILGNPAAIYGNGASFGPYLVDGKIEGFRLHRVPENHIFYSLGARSGDIIKSVNGYNLTNTSQMMEIWNNIKTVPRVTVNLIRNGKPMTINFEIRN